eukprot:scaffold7676_cov258-Pinguiococcus_pyrenoidosus.AAC.10
MRSSLRGQRVEACKIDAAEGGWRLRMRFSRTRQDPMDMTIYFKEVEFQCEGDLDPWLKQAA